MIGGENPQNGRWVFSHDIRSRPEGAGRRVPSHRFSDNLSRRDFEKLPRQSDLTLRHEDQDTVAGNKSSKAMECLLEEGLPAK